MLPTSFPQTPTTRSTSSWLGRGSDDLPGLPDLSFAKTRSWHWTSGWHRATLERNVPRTRSLGRRACSAQDPYQSRAGEPGAPAATRSAPPPLEATAVRAPRSRVLGLSLSAVGRLAEGAPRRSPRDRDSLAPAGLSRFLLHGRGLRGLSVEAARGGLGERLHGPPLHPAGTSGGERLRFERSGWLPCERGRVALGEAEAGSWAPSPTPPSWAQPGGWQGQPQSLGWWQWHSPV